MKLIDSRTVGALTFDFYADAEENKAVVKIVYRETECWESRFETQHGQDVFDLLTDLEENDAIFLMVSAQTNWMKACDLYTRVPTEVFESLVDLDGRVFVLPDTLVDMETVDKDIREALEIMDNAVNTLTAE